MNIETAKETRSFAIQMIILSICTMILSGIIVYTGKSVNPIMPISGGILLAIGLHILPKANKKIKEANSENNEDTIR